jgi:hypothetical protein
MTPMFKKTLTGIATAAVLAAGAFAASTSADAHYSSYSLSGGYYQTVCKTFYETIVVGYDYWNHPIVKTVPYNKCDKIFIPAVTYSTPHYSLSFGFGY